MKLFTLILANLLFAACGTLSAGAATLELADKGKTVYVISLAADAIPAEKTAASQLQKYLGQVTGASFAVHSETEVKSGAPQILVGAGRRAKALLPQQNWGSLGGDGIVIKTVGKNLVLAGGRPRGSLYAVFQFLEDSVGCRWWTPTENAIPQKDSLQVATQNINYVPPFNYREHFTTATFTDPEFATLLKQNGHFQKQSVEWGGHYRVLGWCHTFMQLLPVGTYFKDHPEWYADPQNGNKPCTAASEMPADLSTQVCLSNPEVVEEMAKNALAWIAENPGAGYISISQNDNGNFCRDEKCAALAASEGSQAGPVLDFVNKVAARIHEKYPDFLVDTLAYSGTDKPPKTIRPGKNVVIRMAPVWSDYGHPLNSDWNMEARDNITGWAKIAPRLFVWNYVNNFENSMVVHPNWDGLAKDLRFFAANNVKGVFEQGDAYEDPLYSTNSVGDFVQLRAWLMGKLLWNPALDQDKIISEFLRGYYGPAAPFLKKYLDLVQTSYLDQNRKLSTYNDDFTFLSLSVTNQLIRYFDQAEAAVKNDKELLNRVRRDRLSLQAALFNRYKALKAEADREGREFLGPKDPHAALADFSASAAAYGVTAGFLSTQVPRFAEKIAVLPDFLRTYPADDVVDLQPHTFKLHRLGVFTARENDVQASVGTAVSTIGSSTDWNIQVPAGAFVDTLTDKWRVYALVRMEGKTNPPNENAFVAGLFDMKGRTKVPNEKGLDSIPVSITQIKGQGYQIVNLGIYALNSAESIIYFQPVGNPDISKIYLDRVLLVRQPK